MDETNLQRRCQRDPVVAQLRQQGIALFGQIDTNLQGQQQALQGQYQQLQYHQEVLNLADSKVSRMAAEVAALKQCLPGLAAKVFRQVSSNMRHGI